MPAACDKKVLFDRRKKRCDFSSAGLTLMLQTTQYSQSQLISKSLCGKCTNYIFEPNDTYGTWCIYHKDIYKAINDGKIITHHQSEPTDRSVHYNLYGIVYCEGYKPK
jgi:hypothetical protein